MEEHTPAHTNKTSKTGTTELPILFFETAEAWRQWLEKNQDSLAGIWLKFYKKGSGTTSLKYGLALDEALCYGWIDGQAKKYDENSYLQKFTPRRAKSIWSKRNIEHISRLEQEGKMTPRGWKEVEAARAEGRWAQAYDSPTHATLPDDFLQEISKNKQALTFFESLNKTNKYAIVWRLQTAKKPETREKRKKAIIEMLMRGEKFH
jgi:uncharacterized protein YdeI (YjbR/CyaY-like superfamily)